MRTKRGDNEKGFWSRIGDAMRNKTNDVNIGDVGVYNDKLELYSHNDDNDSSKHTYNAKVRVVGVYQSLVEIELVDEIKISDSTSEEITHLIQKNFPKFANPNNIRWAIKS
jgi:hypothetical protein